MQGETLSPPSILFTASDVGCCTITVSTVTSTRIGFNIIPLPTMHYGNRLSNGGQRVAGAAMQLGMSCFCVLVYYNNICIRMYNTIEHNIFYCPDDVYIIKLNWLFHLLTIGITPGCHLRVSVRLIMIFSPQTNQILVYSIMHAWHAQ